MRMVFSDAMLMPLRNIQGVLDEVADCLDGDMDISDRDEDRDESVMVSREQAREAHKVISAVIDVGTYSSNDLKKTARVADRLSSQLPPPNDKNLEIASEQLSRMAMMFVRDVKAPIEALNAVMGALEVTSLYIVISEKRGGLKPGLGFNSSDLRTVLDYLKQFLAAGTLTPNERDNMMVSLRRIESAICFNFKLQFSAAIGVFQS